MAARINFPCAAICQDCGKFVTTTAPSPSVGEVHYYVSANSKYICGRESIIS